MVTMPLCRVTEKQDKTEFAAIGEQARYAAR